MVTLHTIEDNRFAGALEGQLPPERDHAVTDRAGEVTALLDEAPSDPEPTRRGLDEEQA